MTTDTGVEYVRDDARRRIRVTLRGQPTRDMFATIVDRQVQEQTWQYSLLYDLREMPEPVPWPDAEALAEQVSAYTRAFGRRGPVAVVTSKMRVIGATQVYSYRTGPTRLVMRVFQDVLDAEQWLDQVGRTRA